LRCECRIQWTRERVGPFFHHHTTTTNGTDEGDEERDSGSPALDVAEEWRGLMRGRMG